MFAKVKPRLAVYSHICLPTATETDLLPPTRKTYSGPLQLGEDLMTIDVGDKIDVRRHVRKTGNPGHEPYHERSTAGVPLRTR